MKNEIIKEQLLSKEFWRNHNPDLHICDEQFLQNQKPIRIKKDKKGFVKKQIDIEGYVDLGKLRWDLPIEKMANCAKNLNKNEILPVFSLVYDEFWELLNKLDFYFQAVFCSDYEILPCFWVWVVDPSKGESGWKPHRDKGLNSLFPDNRPKSLTVWIPLTEATPLNGCIYILPMHLDGELQGEKKKITNLSHIRALPAKAGNALLWNQFVFHWGAQTSPRAKRSRVSVAFEVQRSDVPRFKPKLLKPLKNHSLDTRVKLICKQILQYTHMYDLAEQFKDVAQEILNDSDSK